MTRKRSKYRPKGVIKDTMQFVLQGLSPLASQEDANIVLRMRNTEAHGAILNGTATANDLDVLIAMSNMATALARKHGTDWREEIRASTDAIEAIQKRYYRWKKIQATSAELEAITLMARIHEAQLDASTVIDIEKALDIAKRGVAAVQKETS